VDKSVTEHLYFIYLVKGRISVFVFDDGNFIAIKFKGEVSQAFNKMRFWESWKLKLAYRDNPVSFIVLSDDSSFSIPADIILAPKNSVLLVLDEIEDFFLAKSISLDALVTFPAVENWSDRWEKIEVEHPKKVAVVEQVDLDVIEPSGFNLAASYRKQTREFQK